MRFLSLKVAPGVRVSASPRGIRSHLGPRVARIHVGGGRTGVSTGAGPLTVYEPLGGSSRKATRGMTPKQTERHQQVVRVAQQFAHFENLHREDFAAPERQVISPAALPKFGKLPATAEKQTLSGVGRFDRDARTAKKAEARELAERWAVDLMALAESERRLQQDRIDRDWDDLNRNQPEAVVKALNSTYAADVRRARVVGAENGEAELLLWVDGPELLPESKPATTASGAPTLHKLNKTDRAAWHRQIVASQVLLAAKKALAAAPGLECVRVVGVDGADAPLLGARVTRVGLASADWRADAWSILARLDRDLRCDLRGRTQELRTMDLRRDPEFGAAVAALR